MIENTSNRYLKSVTLSVAVMDHIEKVRGENARATFLYTATKVLANAVIAHVLAGINEADQDNRSVSIWEALEFDQVRLVIDGTLTEVDETKPVMVGPFTAPRKVQLTPDVEETMMIAKGDVSTSKFIAVAAATLAAAIDAYATDENGRFDTFRRDVAFVAAKHHQVRIHIDGGAA